jgi:hypothetical protein
VPVGSIGCPRRSAPRKSGARFTPYGNLSRVIAEFKHLLRDVPAGTEIEFLHEVCGLPLALYRRVQEDHLVVHVKEDRAYRGATPAERAEIQERISGGLGLRRAQFSSRFSKALLGQYGPPQTADDFRVHMLSDSRTFLSAVEAGTLPPDFGGVLWDSGRTLYEEAQIIEGHARNSVERAGAVKGAVTGAIHKVRVYDGIEKWVWWCKRDRCGKNPRGGIPIDRRADRLWKLKVYEEKNGLYVLV